MTKYLLAVATAVGFMSSTALAQIYIPMSPPPTVPPYFGLPGSTTTTATTSLTTDHTKTVADPDGSANTTHAVKTAKKQE